MGYLKRQKMVDEAVERKVKSMYPSGLAASAGGMLERKKIRAEMVAKLTSKNKNLLKY